MMNPNNRPSFPIRHASPGWRRIVSILAFVPLAMCATGGLVEVGVVAGAGTMVGCNTTRGAAAADLSTKAAKCVADKLAENMNRDPKDFLIECAVPRDSNDWKSIYDLIVGAQVATINAGVSLPNAGVAAGMAHPPARDAGAR